MVTAEVKCVSAQQQPRRWEGRVSDERDRSPARLRRLGKNSCRVKNDTLDKKKKCLYLFSMNFCSINRGWGCSMKCRGGKKKQKQTRQQMEQKDCRGKKGLPGLWEKGSRRTCFCFCCVSFTRRELWGLELRTNCVSTISFPPLSTASCTAIRHKTAAGI